jgi:hypothetical protein
LSPWRLIELRFDFACLIDGPRNFRVPPALGLFGLLLLNGYDIGIVSFSFFLTATFFLVGCFFLSGGSGSSLGNKSGGIRRSGMPSGACGGGSGGCGSGLGGLSAGMADPGG